MQIAQDGRLGAVQLNSEALAAAPQAPTPALGFISRPASRNTPVSSPRK